MNPQFADLTPEQRQLIELMLRKNEEAQSPESKHPVTGQNDIGVDLLPSSQHRMKGLVPLTGQQQWFFENVDDYGGRWIWVMPYEVPSIWGQTPHLIEQILQAVLTHHDELRVRFVRQENGWQQSISEPDGPIPFKCMDLSGLETLEQDQAIKTASDALQRDMTLSTPLLRMSLFYLGDKRPARLIIFAHHLLIDRYSLGILADDFQTAYVQLTRGEPVSLPPRRGSVQDHIEHLQAYARSDEMRHELDAYWQTLPWDRLAPLPLDDPSGETIQTVGSMASVEVALSVEETRILQTDILRVYKAQIKDVLLMAVMQAVTQWTGQSHQLIGWVYDGRRDIIPVRANFDLAFTVGWLSLSSYHLLERVTDHAPVESLLAIQKQLLHIPNKGLGWYILRHYGDAGLVEPVKALFNKNTVVIINYLGTITDPSSNQFQIMRPVSEPKPLPSDPQSRNFREPLLVNARIANGCFSARWEYNKRVHNQSTIEQIASNFRDTLRDLIATHRS